MQTELANKRIVVTGGTTGIGRAATLLFLGRGARVLTLGRHQKEMDDAMRDFKKAGGTIHRTIADMAKLPDVRRVFKEADAELGGIDILVNNAALGAEGIGDMKTDDWEYVVRSNLIGYMACAQEALQRMKPQKYGHIVNVGSMSADVRESGSSVYVATKSGIQGFSEALRKEVNEMGIKVSLIEPGATGTDMQEDPPEKQRQKEARGEMLTAEDVARSIEYCLTQPARCDVVALQLRPHRQPI